MGASILPDLGTEILIPVCAVIGIGFALFQWLLVSKVKLSAARDASPNAAGKNGYNDYLIEEEEGINDHNVVLKCAEIQSAISEGLSLPFKNSFLYFLFIVFCCSCKVCVFWILRSTHEFFSACFCLWCRKMIRVKEIDWWV